MNEKEFLTKKEICEKLKISETTLYRLTKQGLPNIYVGDSQRFELNEVINWFKERKK